MIEFICLSNPDEPEILHLNLDFDARLPEGPGRADDEESEGDAFHKAEGAREPGGGGQAEASATA